MPPRNDILLVSVTDNGNGAVGLNMPAPGFTVTGIQKLVQTYLSLLFTRQGTVKSRPTFGTSFFSLLTGSNVNRSGQVETAFQVANNEITAWYNTFIGTSVPDDERFESSTLLAYSLPQPDTVNLTIQINSRAGDSYIYEAPQKLIQV